MSEVSGRTTVLAKLAQVAPELTKNSPEVAEIVLKLKELEHDGFQFEAADASFELMVLRTLKRYQPHFTLGMYRISGEYPFPDGGPERLGHAFQVGGRAAGNDSRHGPRPRARADTALQSVVCVLPGTGSCAVDRL